MGKSSAPAPDYAPLASASKESAQIMAGLGKEQLGFARQQYAEISPLLRGIAEQQRAAQDEQMRQAQDYYRYQTETFRPVERALVADAQKFNTEEYRNQLAQQAAADAGRAFGLTQQASQRASAAMGVNPASGRFAGMQQQSDNQLAAQRAAAMTGTRQQAQQMGYARRLDAAGLGRGLAGASTAAYQGAVGAGTAAGNSFMAPGNQFNAAFGQGAGLIGSGRQMFQQGLGQILGTQGQIYAADASRPDPFATIVGAGLGGWAGGGFKGFSDIRLKENIEEVGVDPRTNLNLYHFNYIDDPHTRWQGVMAHEVEEHYPEAVIEASNGYKMVNYDALGISMKKV
jgi:hypothetical protein